MPTINEVHPGNIPLTNISIAYTNDLYIAEDIFPTVVVQKESDRFYIFNKDNLRLEETTKGSQSEANKVRHTLSTGNYQIVVHALEQLVTPREMENADSPLSPMQDATENVTEKLKIRLEEDVATNVMSTSTYNTGLKSTTGLPAWNGSSGNVIEQITSGVYQILGQIGKLGNMVVMDSSTFLGLKTNTQILNRIKFTSAEAISKDIMARLFEIPKILVGTANKNTANEGQADSLSGQWTEGCAILYVESSPGIRKPTFGYMFRKSGSRVVETRQADNIETGARYVRVIDGYDDKVIDASAGYLLTNTVQ